MGDSGLNRGCITALAVVGGIAACILLVFGVLLILASTDPTAEAGWFVIGIAMVGTALAIIALAVVALVVIYRRARAEQPQEIVQKIDLSGDIAMEKLKCQECGAELEKDSVSVREGAIFIACPYCGSTYQMVEEPKW